MTEYGISISQEGTPVKTAADYQKVLDSRWKFLELELEYDVNMVLDALPSGPVAAVDVPIVNHGLGFIPMFEANVKVVAGDSFPVSVPAILADKNHIFFRRVQSSGSISSQTMRGRIRVYNLAILEEYKAPKQIASPESSIVSKVGFRALDGSLPYLGSNSNSKTGYSIDTKKKILSVHRTGLVYINEYVFRRLKISAVNTATNEFTYSDGTATTINPAGTGLEWVKTGTPVRYVVSGTYPAPLISSGAYYIIVINQTTIRLAATAADANAGNAIDITSSGTLPGSIEMIGTPDMARIYHDVGYPPTFLLAEMDSLLNSEAIGPIQESPAVLTLANNSFLEFRGAQGVFAGKFGFVILKDPAEIAK